MELNSAPILAPWTVAAGNVAAGPPGLNAPRVAFGVCEKLGE